MYAIEFKTILENDMVKIPKQYLSKLHKIVRVIIIDEPESEQLSGIKSFTAAKIKTSNFKFNREEANER